MTVKELDALEARIADGKRARQRMAGLRDGLDKIGKSAKLLLVPLDGVGSLYVGDRDQGGKPAETRWIQVCWAANEGGLANEILEAVRDVVMRRIEAAQAEFEKL